MSRNARDSGVFRAFGQWTLVGRDSENTGTLVYKVENRRRLGTDIAPKDLGAALSVIRAKSNFQFRRIYSHPIDKDTGIKCDQTIALTGPHTFKDYPEKLPRIKYHHAQSNKTLVFLTNSLTLPALTISKLYKCRWQVELFFKWIKQNLRTKSLNHRQ